MAGKKVDKFEENLDQLEEIVDQLESGDLSLEESLDKFEKGVKLYKDCRKKLTQVESKIKKLTEALKEEDIELDEADQD